LSHLPDFSILYPAVQYGQASSEAVRIDPGCAMGPGPDDSTMELLRPGSSATAR